MPNMNARGERILIFGDSLSVHPGSIPVWDVDQGSNRNGTPGELLASLLLEQGAEAVRVNAKGGRSAYNFWTVEPSWELVAGDLAWRPTKIIFVLGTNDVGMTVGPVEQAYRKIIEAYKPSKAEMWSIGPFINRQDATQRQAVVDIQKRVFGMRAIDGRPISQNIAPGSDGIHYNYQGAKQLALAMADAWLSAFNPKAWAGVAIGAAAIVGGALASSWYKRKGRSLKGINDAINIVDGARYVGNTNALIRSGYRQVPCRSGLDRKGLARCWSR